MAAQSGTSARAGGGGAGKANATNLTITKRIDRSSPLLFTAAATGKHYPTVAIHVTTPTLLLDVAGNLGLHSVL